MFRENTGLMVNVKHPSDSLAVLKRVKLWTKFFVFLCAFGLSLALLLPADANAQRGGRGGRGTAPTAREAAPIDLTGYWVSVITEAWKLRMVTPKKGVLEMLTLNAEGRRVAEAWDPAKDEAAAEQCRSYGAANIMRVPGRLHVTWENDTTLRIDTDAGTQTRLFHFGAPAASPGEPSWQGYSVAEWQNAAGARGAQQRGGSLKVVTTNLRLGYIRKNGAPYSNKTVVTEYYDVNTMPNGDQWISVTTKVEDPVYFSRYYMTSSDFKKLPDGTGFNPTPCSAR